jgi:hypothetical protein
VPVIPRQRRGGVGGAAGVGQQRLERPLSHQHQRAVDDVLAGGARVHVLPGGLGHGLAQRGHQAHHRGRMPGGLSAQRAGIEVVGPTCVGDLGGRRLGDLPGRGQRARQRRLHVEHRLQPGGIAHLRGRASPRVDAIQ